MHLDIVICKKCSDAYCAFCGICKNCNKNTHIIDEKLVKLRTQVCFHNICKPPKNEFADARGLLISAKKAQQRGKLFDALKLCSQASDILQEEARKYSVAQVGWEKQCKKHHEYWAKNDLAYEICRGLGGILVELGDTNLGKGWLRDAEKLSKERRRKRNSE